MILFTKSTAVLHRYLSDELKTLRLLQFFPEVAQNSEFSMFREIPEYSSFSRFVATLFYHCSYTVAAAAAGGTATSLLLLLLLQLLLTLLFV